MTLDHRLDRLAPGLSARERALLSMRATLDDQREDPAIRGTMPREQIAEFNHFIALGNGVLHVLLPHAIVLDGDVEALRLRYLLLLTLDLLTQRGSPDRSAALTDRVQRDFVGCWSRLLAQERVGAEIEQEFGDPAAFPPEWRNLLTGARSELDQLYADAGLHLGSVELPGASEATLAQLHEGVRSQATS